MSHALPASTVQERCGASANNAARYPWLIPTKLRYTAHPAFATFFFSYPFFILLMVVTRMLPSWTFSTRKLESACRCSYPAFPFPSLTPISPTPVSHRHPGTFDSTHSPILANVDSVSASYILLLFCYTRSSAPECCLVLSCFDVNHPCEQSCFLILSSE